MVGYRHFYFLYSCFNNDILWCCQDKNKAILSRDEMKDFIRIWDFLKEIHNDQISRAS